MNTIKTDYHILFDHSNLELCRDKLFKNLNSIKNDAKRRNKRIDDILYDKAIHTSNRKIPQLEKYGRGRPDILHSNLLNVVYSPLFTQEKNLTIHVHTLKNHYFTIPADWRIPVNYTRFYYLMEYFLKKGYIKYGNKKIKLEKKNINSLIDQIQAESIVKLSSQGKRSLKEIKLRTPALFLIGSYNKGNYPINYPKTVTFLDDSKIYPAWRITGKLICYLEEGILDIEDT